METRLQNDVCAKAERRCWFDEDANGRKRREDDDVPFSDNASFTTTATTGHHDHHHKHQIRILESYFNPPGSSSQGMANLFKQMMPAITFRVLFALLRFVTTLVRCCIQVAVENRKGKHENTHFLWNTSWYAAAMEFIFNVTWRKRFRMVLILVLLNWCMPFTLDRSFVIALAMSNLGHTSWGCESGWDWGWGGCKLRRRLPTRSCWKFETLLSWKKTDLSFQHRCQNFGTHTFHVGLHRSLLSLPLGQIGNKSNRLDPIADASLHHHPHPCLPEKIPAIRTRDCTSLILLTLFDSFTRCSRGNAWGYTFLACSQIKTRYE
jgi:hypothetical protein